MATARKAWADDTVTDLLDSIDARITSRVLRMALFSAARELVGVDDEVTPEEGTPARRDRRPLRLTSRRRSTPDLGPTATRSRPARSGRIATSA